MGSLVEYLGQTPWNQNIYSLSPLVVFVAPYASVLVGIGHSTGP